jgi:excisionase family DNA binding protein
LLTVAEAAGRARCSIRTVRRALQAGRLRASQPAGRGGKLLIAVDDLDWWLFGRRNSAEQATETKGASRKRRVESRGTPSPISIEIEFDGKWRLAPAGSTVFVRAGTIHAFRRSSSSGNIPGRNGKRFTSATGRLRW